MVVSSELSAAVDAAYRVFGRYTLGGRIIVCNCNVCVAPEVEKELIKTPLWELSSLTLAEYTHSAHDWDGRVEDDLKYFLPRYFDLIALGSPPSNTGLETCLQRLANANYRAEWPAAERAAVDAFFTTFLRDTLNSPVVFEHGWIPSYPCDPVEEALCMVAFAGGDVGAMLLLWEQERGRNPDQHLAGMVASADWLKRRLRNSFWYGIRNERVEAEGERVMAWLVRAETRARLEEACLNESDPEAGELLSFAEGVLSGQLARQA